MRTRSQARRLRQQQQRQQQQVPPNLVEPPKDTMADNRTMAELLRLPRGIQRTQLLFLENPRIWLEKEPSRSIQTWDDLVAKFINQFFPPSKMTNLQNEITNFKQRFDESFSEAWDRFKDLLRACPHHGFSELHQLQNLIYAVPDIKMWKATVDITELFRKLKFICHWANPFKDFERSNVLGIKLSLFSESDDTFMSLQALSNLHYLFSGFMDYFWSHLDGKYHSKQQNRHFLLVMLRLELHVAFVLAVGKPTLDLHPDILLVFLG
ncbi:reverse transcriptase domain-containing protein [Tanacetum coccineum]